MIQKKILCAHLWNHSVVDFRTQEFRMCCKTTPLKTSEEQLKLDKDQIFLNSKDVLFAREEMLKGLKTKMCQQCWDIEAGGFPSHRTSSDDWERSVKDTNFPKIDLLTSSPSDLVYSKFPNNLDIQLGNTCDLKCVYCNDRFSTSWKNENLIFGDMFYEKDRDSFLENSESHQNLFLENFWTFFNATKGSYERIAFLGGEPLVSGNFYLTLEKLLSIFTKPSKKLEINIITNLNTPDHFFKRFLLLLPQLSEKFIININISMESWGTSAEFIRSGLNFDRFINNFNQLVGSNHFLYSTIKI